MKVSIVLYFGIMANYNTCVKGTGKLAFRWIPGHVMTSSTSVIIGLRQTLQSNDLKECTKTDGYETRRGCKLL